MRVVFFGNNERGVACLEAVNCSDHQVVLVVADPRSGEDGYYKSIAPKASSLGLPLITPEKVNADEVIETLNMAGADIGVLVGYGRLIGARVISVFRRGCINLHASPLPEYRGAGTLNWQIINGEAEGAISIIQVDGGIDTGDILAQQGFEIGANETIADVAARVNELYPPLLVDTLDKISAGTVRRVGQDPTAGSYYARRYPRDGLINWGTTSAERAHNTIRALTRPYPGAFSFSVSARVLLWKSQLLDTAYHGPPGRVAAMIGDGAVVLAADRGLLITHVGRDDGSEGSPRDLGIRAGDDLTARFA